MERTAFVTDVEGNFEYFERFLRLSHAFQTPDGPLVWDKDHAAIVTLNPGWAFVHGGDCVDKGGKVGGSIRVVKSLLRLKRLYPDRVTLIAGNRDINKMRFTSELSTDQMRRLDLPGPYWVPVENRVSPADYLRGLQTELGSTTAPIEELNSLANRIKWMLKHTLGADGEFERRKAELELLNGDTSCSEDSVCQSFIESVAEGGFMRELLLRSQLILLRDNTLYVHGGLTHRGPKGTEEIVGVVPGCADKITDVREWACKLNEWYLKQVEEWITQPNWADPQTTLSSSCRGGHALIHYAVPNDTPSVINGGHLGRNGMPEPAGEALASTLNKAGVERLVVGHIPHGSSPTVIKSRGYGVDDPILEIIMCDTSYSDMGVDDNRGIAVSELVIESSGAAHVHGVQHDGDELEFNLAPGVGPASELIGQLEPVDDGRFVKAYIPKRREFILCRVRGFTVSYDFLTVEETKSIFGIVAPHGRVTPVERNKSKVKFYSHGESINLGRHHFDHMEDLAALSEDIFDTAAPLAENGEIPLQELRDSILLNQSVIKILSGHVTLAKSIESIVEDLLVAADKNNSGTLTKGEYTQFFKSVRSLCSSPLLATDSLNLTVDSIENRSGPRDVRVGVCDVAALLATVPALVPTRFGYGLEMLKPATREESPALTTGADASPIASAVSYETPTHMQDSYMNPKKTVDRLLDSPFAEDSSAPSTPFVSSAHESSHTLNAQVAEQNYTPGVADAGGELATKNGRVTSVEIADLSLSGIDTHLGCGTDTIRQQALANLLDDCINDTDLSFGDNMSTNSWPPLSPAADPGLVCWVDGDNSVEIKGEGAHADQAAFIEPKGLFGVTARRSLIPGHDSPASSQSSFCNPTPDNGDAMKSLENSIASSVASPKAEDDPGTEREVIQSRLFQERVHASPSTQRPPPSPLAEGRDAQEQSLNTPPQSRIADRLEPWTNESDKSWASGELAPPMNPVGELTVAGFESSKDTIFCGWSRKRVAPYIWAPKYFVITHSAELMWFDAFQNGQQLKHRGLLELSRGALIQRMGTGSDFSFKVGIRDAGCVRISPGSQRAYDLWQEGLQRALTRVKPPGDSSIIPQACALNFLSSSSSAEQV